MKNVSVAHISNIPNTCGVYIFSNSDDLIIYIGKSIHLRNRVRQHLSKSGNSKERGFSRSVVKIDYIETANELLALLLEDALIKKYWPPFNKKQKKTLLQTYLCFSKEDFPYLMIQSDKDKNENSFGPFKDSFYVEDLIIIMQRRFGLRGCDGILPNSECTKGSIGICTAPCVKKIGKDSYHQNVLQAELFLRTGTEGELFSRLANKMKDLSDNENFEKAAEIRDDIRFLHHFSSRQKFLHQFYNQKIAIYCEKPSPEIYITDMGSLQYYILIDKTNYRNIDDLIEDCKLKKLKTISLFEIEHKSPAGLFDRGIILYSWLNSDRENHKYLVL